VILVKEKYMANRCTSATLSSNYKLGIWEWKMEWVIKNAKWEMGIFFKKWEWNGTGQPSMEWEWVEQLIFKMGKL
jgi:hypothetical protein